MRTSAGKAKIGQTLLHESKLLRDSKSPGEYMEKVSHLFLAVLLDTIGRLDKADFSKRPCCVRIWYSRCKGLESWEVGLT
jgi:hypothetical protein